MIVKIIPEEGDNVSEVEHHGVKDFFLCGFKETEDGTEDFHDWRGGYKFLIGNLFYFLNKIQGEEESKTGKSKNKVKADFRPKLVEPELNNGPQIVEIDKDTLATTDNNGNNVEANATPFIKKISADQPDLKLIDTDNIEEHKKE